jgi:type VI secretion system secreted protein Hcp
MDTSYYMSITGEKQGLITADAFTADSVGNIYQEGHGSGIQPRSDHSA